MISLEQLLDDARQQSRTLAPDIAVRLLCAAVRIAASSGVQLRPRRLLLQDNGELKLDADSPTDGGDRSGYLAPEVVAGLSSADDPRSLVYAAGALGYELLTGNATPDRRLAGAPELPEPVSAILRKTLAVRHQRFATLSELSEQLEAATAVTLKRVGGVTSFHDVIQPGAAAGDDRTQPFIPFLRRAPDAAADDPAAAVKSQLGAAQRKIAKLEQDIAAHTAASSEREEKHRATIAALEERVQALSRLARAAASGSWSERPISNPPRPRSGVLLGAGAALLLVAGAVLFLAWRAGAFATRQASAPAVETPGSSSQDVTGAPAPKADAPAAPTGSAPQPQRPRTLPPAPAAAQEQARSKIQAGDRALQAGRGDEAVADFQAAIAADPRQTTALRGLAAAYMLRGDQKNAKKQYEQYLRSTPGAPDAERVRRILDDLAAADAASAKRAK
jgi:tetratricopeptide (TPR) repeat protein